MNVYNTVLLEFEEFVSLAELVDTEVSKLRGPSYKLPPRSFAAWCRFARGIIGEVRQIQVRRLFFEPSAPSLTIKTGNTTTSTLVGIINTFVFSPTSVNIIGSTAYFTPTLTVREVDGLPTGNAKTLVFPNGSVSFNSGGDIATITFPAAPPPSGGSSNPEFQWSLTSSVGISPAVINIAPGRAMVATNSLNPDPGTFRLVPASVQTFTLDGFYCIVVDTEDLSAEQYYEPFGALDGYASPDLPGDLTPRYPNYFSDFIHWWKRLERVPIWILKVETVLGTTTVSEVRDLRPVGSDPLLRLLIEQAGRSASVLAERTTALEVKPYPSDLRFEFLGPVGANEEIFFDVLRNTNLSGYGHFANARIPASDTSVVMQILMHPSDNPVGTVTFAPFAPNGTVNITLSSYIVSSTLKVVAPPAVDSTLSGVRITLRGTTTLGSPP